MTFVKISSAVTLVAAFATTLCGIWTDNEHWADTAALAWFSVAVPIVGFFAVQIHRHAEIDREKERLKLERDYAIRPTSYQQPVRKSLGTWD